MFPDYISVVMATYHQKMASDSLSPRLIRPTPGNLKRECIAVCNERFEKRDNGILRAFFGQSGDVSSHLQAIEECDSDKFKPLINFLNGKTTNTDVKNIELLAWLIDFKQRPYQYDKKYEIVNVVKGLNEQAGNESSHEGERAVEQPAIKQKEPGADPAGQYSKRHKTAFHKRRLFFLILAIFVLVFIGFKWGCNNIPSDLTQYKACMYWVDDHYEAIPCSQKVSGVAIALDSSRLKNFKRITRIDTITHYSIGKIWYIKRHGVLEYYTSGGYHPEDMQVQLRPITAYIINTYLAAKSQ